jgi:hypothetical protein
MQDIIAKNMPVNNFLPISPPLLRTETTGVSRGFRQVEPGHQVYPRDSVMFGIAEQESAIGAPRPLGAPGVLALHHSLLAEFFAVLGGERFVLGIGVREVSVAIIACHEIDIVGVGWTGHCLKRS